jgi:CheY-like chemotaxis protein
MDPRDADEDVITGFRARVCVVEDNPIIAMDTSEMLVDLGYTVDGPYHSLKAATNGCQACNFDCALLDVNLGRGETSEAIALLLRDRQVPFAFVSAYDASLIAYREEAEECVAKPVTPHSLEKIVSKLLKCQR